MGRGGGGGGKRLHLPCRRKPKENKFDFENHVQQSFMTYLSPRNVFFFENEKLLTLLMERIHRYEVTFMT